MLSDPDDQHPTQLECEAYGFVVRFVSGEAGPEDLQALKDWVALSADHRAAFIEASRVWQRVDPTQALLEPPANVVRGRRPVTVERAAIRRRVFIGGALAASVAGTVGLLGLRPPLGLWPSWSELASDYRTQAGERRNIALAESVTVELNTRTSIALRSTSGEPPRLELVEGEALVTASSRAGAPVTVSASGGEVVAFDGRFNIRRNDGSVQVTCLAGTVQVACGQASLALPASHQVVYSPSGVGIPVAVDGETVTAWKDGFIVFDAMPISNVVKELNRYCRNTVILTNSALGRERLNARFRVEHIDGVVGQIEKIFGAHSTQLPGGIILLG